MSGTRCLFRPGDTAPLGPGDGAPRGNGPVSKEEREEIAAFLEGALMKPLHHNRLQHDQRVSASINTMTRAERVYLEIEMQDQRRAVHSFDYDPIR